MLALLALPGCETLGGPRAGGGTGQPPATAAALARPADPLAEFAARATPGQEERVGNPPVSARLMRAYNAGTGRPCRELLLGGMNAGRQLVYCEDSPGLWSMVRPLLRNGPV